MTAPYSVDLRSRALARKAAGETHREIAQALRISPSCLSKWARHERETGSLAPTRMGGCKPRTLSGECAEWLRERVASGPVTLRGLAAELAERGIKTAPRAVWVFPSRRGAQLQKKPCCLKSRRAPTSLAGVSAGKPIRAASRLLAWYSSTRRG